jgi:Domain of unknown function (DUF2828)
LRLEGGFDRWTRRLSSLNVPRRGPLWLTKLYLATTTTSASLFKPNKEMAAFAAAMDLTAAASSDLALNENGGLQYSDRGVGDGRLALFNKLVRNLGSDDFASLLRTALLESRARSDAAATVDLFVMAVQTRDVRCGKGERSLSYTFLLALHEHFPRTVERLMSLLPEYGTWKDLMLMAELLQTTPTPKNAPLLERILAVTTEQLQADATAEKPSLCAKWAPREGRHFAALAKLLAKRLFPADPAAAAKYRKLVASLTAKLEVVETKMCSGTWASIDPKSVPARCLKTNRHALLNEVLPRTKRRRTKNAGDDASSVSNVRRPDDPDRIQCAEQMHAVLDAAKADPTAKGVHGAVLHPHELVVKCMQSSSEDDIIEAQWRDLRQRFAALGSLGKLVPLVDVSGSMSGDPMNVAIALGILVSELTFEPLRNRFITFESTPQWHMLNAEDSLHAKVASTAAAPWGGSTNFAAAIRLILLAAVQQKLPRDEIEGLTLVVFSDMQFDDASGRSYYSYDDSPRQSDQWSTQHEQLVAEFAAAGYSAPHIVYWNLRGDTKTAAAQSDTPGVSMVSGFSHSLLKLFLEGNLEALSSPMTTLRVVLDDARYDAVRAVCAEVKEGIMSDYVLPEPAEPAAAAAVAPAAAAAAAAADDGFELV